MNEAKDQLERWTNHLIRWSERVTKEIRHHEFSIAAQESKDLIAELDKCNKFANKLADIL